MLSPSCLEEVYGLMTLAYGANPIACWVDKDQPVTVIYKESEVYPLSLFKNQQDQPSGQRENAQTYLVLIYL